MAFKSRESTTPKSIKNVNLCVENTLYIFSFWQQAYKGLNLEEKDRDREENREEEK